MKYTIFGHKGYLGNEFKNYLINKKYKVFLPKRNEFKLNKYSKDVIYFIGSDNKKNILGFLNSNFVHLFNLLNHNNLNSIVFISSTRIYLSQKKKIINEDDNLKLFNSEKYLFNTLKLLSERMALLVPNCKIIRISNVFGRNKKKDTFLPKMINNAKKKKLKLLINKISSKDYIYIDDVLLGIFNILIYGKKKIYNLASGKKISIEKITKKLQKKFHGKIKYKNQNSFETYPSVSIKRIQKEFKFKPTKTILEYLDEI